MTPEPAAPPPPSGGQRSGGVGLPARVGINAVFLMPGMGGLDTYVQELVPELVRLAPTVRFSIFCSKAGAEHLRQLSWADEVEFVTHPMLGRRGLKAVGEMTVLGMLAGRRVDLLHSVGMTAPLRTRAVNVVMIADVIWMLGPPANATFRLWRLLVPPLARRADRIITISDAAAEQIELHLHVPRERIDVTLLGHAMHRARGQLPEDQLRDRFSLGEETIVLTVAARRPHKNLLRLIAAMPAVLAARPETMLVLCGAATPHDAELRAVARRLGVADHVAFLPFVDSVELEGLYAAAACFVLPSITEGFGLPLLEAMGRGVPVACSNISALPEVAGDAAHYFDPFDVSDIARAITEVLADPRLAERLVAAGRRRESSLTWERTAERTLESYERAWQSRT